MKKLVAASIAILMVGAVSTWAATDAKADWAKHCASCHGQDGKGATTMGKKLGVKDYTDAKVQAALKDEEMFKATKEGVKDSSGKVKMKGYADKLNDEQIKALVQHIRSFKK